MTLVVIATIVLVPLCIGIHYEALYLLSNFLKKQLPGSPRFKVAFVILGAFIAHMLEVLVLAVGIFYLCEFQSVGEIQGLDHTFFDYFYFSITTYTSLGIGDLFPVGPIKILVGVEALLGLLLIAWTASFTYFQKQRSWGEMVD